MFEEIGKKAGTPGDLRGFVWMYVSVVWMYVSVVCNVSVVSVVVCLCRAHLCPLYCVCIYRCTCSSVVLYIYM